MLQRKICRSLILAGTLCTGLLAQISAQEDRSARLYQGTPLDPQIQAMVDSVSTKRITSYLEKLFTFETRHTNSDTISDTRGIGAARRWIKSKFQEWRDGAGSRLVPEFFWFNATVCGIPGLHANVNALLPGIQAESIDRHFIVSGHMDSRNASQCDAEVFAPGINDDGSGTAASIELARIMSMFEFDANIIFMTVTGEDEGLIGSDAYAAWAAANDLRIDGMLTNDVVGNIIGPDGNIDSTSIRHFSAGPSTSISRQLSRYFKLKGEQYVPSMTVNLIPAEDRPGRGGDHQPFSDRGYAAVRFTEPAERLEHQHSDTDVLENMSPAYTAQVTKVSLAGLASMALAPATPTATMAVRDAGNGSDLLLAWEKSNREPDFAGYRVAWRHPDSLFYQEIIPVGNQTEFLLTGLTPEVPVYLSYSALDHVGHESIFSGEVMATPQSIPKAPEKLASTSSATEILLEWNANLELDLAGYRITRREPGTAQAKFEVDAATTEFIDRTVQPHVLYRYTIQAMDNEGNESPPSAVARGRLATHDRGILLVDGTKDGLSRPLQPSDEEVDMFYQEIASGFDLAAQWDLADSAQQNIAISDADMSIYSTVIVHSDVSPPANPLVADTTAMRKYLENGGKLILTGWSLVNNISGLVQPEKEFNPGDFAYDVLKIERARTGSGADRDFAGANAVAEGYTSLTVDPIKVPVFGNNLIAMEVFESLTGEDETEVLFTYRSSADPPSPNDGLPVAFKHISDQLVLAVIDFPLFFFSEESAAAVLSQILLDLGEVSTGVDDRQVNSAAKLNSFALAQNYPNPIRRSAGPTGAISERRQTIIGYNLPVESTVQIRIFNLLGQLVRVLVDKDMPRGHHRAVWDGTDAANELVPSGIYFYQISAGDFEQVRKLIVME